MTFTTKPGSRIIMAFFKQNIQEKMHDMQYHDVMVTTFCKSSLNQFKSD